MTIDEFIEQEVQRIVAFEKMWKKENINNCSDYPYAMEPGDWDEQYMAYNGELA